MQEQNDFCVVGGACAGIHLGCTTRRRVAHADRGISCKHGAARIAAATVDGDHVDRFDCLDRAEQRRKRLRQLSGLIQERNDDRKLHRLSLTAPCRDRIFRTMTGTRASIASSRRLPISSGDTSPLSDSMLPRA